MLVKNLSILEEDFVPDFRAEEVLFRKEQAKDLYACAKRKINCFLYGSSGTGKTMIAKLVLRELRWEGYSVGYVNCWRFDTRRSALQELVWDIGKYRPSIKGGASSEFLKFIEKQRRCIAVLDEVDQLNGKKLIYDLIDSGCTVVGITDEEYALTDLDPRTASRWMPRKIKFPRYTADQIFEILNQRRKEALYPGSVTDSLIRFIAESAEGSARIAIETLRRAAIKASDSNAEKITKECVLEAYKEARHFKRSKILAKLNRDQRTIYEIVRERKEIDSVDLENEYKPRKTNPVKSRTFRSYLRKLIDLKLIEERYLRGKPGKRRILRII